MKRPLIAACCVVALAGLGVLARPNRGAACTMDSRPGVRLPGVSHLILVPTSRVVSAARNLPPNLARARRQRETDEALWRPGMRWWWENRLGRWFKRLRDRPPYGQIATLEHVGGPDSAQVAAAMSAANHEVVVVYWMIDSVCRDALRTERTPVLTAGKRIFVTATLRDTSGWVGGRPTFDVTTSHFVYSESDYAGWSASRGIVPLTSREVMSVYEALPLYDALREQRDTALVMAPLRAWARRHSTLAARPPADAMIEHANTYARHAHELAPFRP